MGAFQNTSLIYAWALAPLPSSPVCPRGDGPVRQRVAVRHAVCLQVHPRRRERSYEFGLDILKTMRQSGDGLPSFMEHFRYEEPCWDRAGLPISRSHRSPATASPHRRSAPWCETSASAQPQSAQTVDHLAMMKAKLVGFIAPPSRAPSRYPASTRRCPRKMRAPSRPSRCRHQAALTMNAGLIIEIRSIPIFQELKGQILFECGRKVGSTASVGLQLEPRCAAEGEPCALADATKSRDEAIKEAEGLLMDALELEAHNVFAWNQLAVRYAKQDRNRDADLATAEEAYIVGNMARAFTFARRRGS